MKDFNVCGIYKITNLKNNKYYIGSSYNVKTRIRKHFELLKRNKHHSIHFQNAYNKYGRKSFYYEVLEICDVNNILIIEQTYLDNISNWKKVYNISRIASGSNYDILTHPNQKEIRLKMSIGNSGKHTKPFYVNNIRYEKLQDAADEFKVDIKSISYRIKNWNYKNYFYENKPKIGDYNKAINTEYWYKPKQKSKKYYCDCGNEISKHGKYCNDCIIERRKKIIYDNPVVISDIEYVNAKRASKILNIKYATLIYRIKSNTIMFKDYYYKSSPKDINQLISIEDINNKISIKNKGNLGRKNKKPFMIKNIRYESLGDASRKLNLKKQLIWDRLRSNNFNDYIYI